MFFSIVINNYNYARFLREAVDSALAQKYSDKEIIVVDDGSTDDSREILETYGDRIRTVYKENGGQASAFNAGFKASSGEWILFLDADDFLKPEALERLQAALEMADERGISVQWPLVNVDGEGKEMQPPQTTPKRLHGKDPKTALLNGEHYGASPTSGNLFHRSVLDSLLPMPEEPYRICADLYLQVSIPFYGLIHWMHEPLGCYRIHGRNHYAGNGNRPDYTQLKRSIYLRETKRGRIRDLALQFSFPIREGLEAGEIQDIPFRILVQRFEPRSPATGSRWSGVGQIMANLGLLFKSKGFSATINTYVRAIFYALAPFCFLKKRYA